MPDIGFGEIVVIVVLALVVFGPDRLPKMAADAARTLRQVRLMAASARRDLVDAAGIQDDGEMAQTVRDLRDLDPRRAMQGILDDPEPRQPARPRQARKAPPVVEPAVPGPVVPEPAVPGPAVPELAIPEPAVSEPAPVDPDWT